MYRDTELAHICYILTVSSCEDIGSVMLSYIDSAQSDGHCLSSNTQLEIGLLSLICVQIHNESSVMQTYSGNLISRVHWKHLVAKQ